MARGRFITLEGGEGAGKSTQARWLAEDLEERGFRCAVTREPGGSPGAEAVRALLLGDVVSSWQPLSEALLHFAARNEHVREMVAPTLAAGTWVVCDRFVDSTRAYQGYGGGVPQGALDRLEEMVLGGLRPDLTLILDVPVTTGLDRAASRRDGGTRYERMDVAFHERLRAGFLEIARTQPDRCAVIDASAPAESVRAEIRRAVGRRLKVW